MKRDGVRERIREEQKERMEEIEQRLKIKVLDEWMGIKRKRMEEEGGKDISFLLSLFSFDLPQLLSTFHPSHPFPFHSMKYIPPSLKYTPLPPPPPPPPSMKYTPPLPPPSMKYTPPLPQFPSLFSSSSSFYSVNKYKIQHWMRCFLIREKKDWYRIPLYSDHPLLHHHVDVDIKSSSSSRYTSDQSKLYIADQNKTILDTKEGISR